MKQLCVSALLGLLLLSASLCAQTQNIRFQGTAINNQGQVLGNQLITVRLSLFDDIDQGTATYVETQSVTTLASGVFALQVGTGVAVTGTYANINLMAGVHYLKVEIKPTGGSYVSISYGPVAESTTVCPPNPPSAPTAGTHVASATQIVWNWNMVADAMAYKWNTVNDFASATDMGTALTKTETDLTCNTAYTRYVWAYTVCGHSAAVSMSKSTSTCPFACGTPITINHVWGSVAPVNKTVTYGTVTNIPGETTKCWITSNLGADHQATAVDDATEPSAGWYWQFNRAQGYKADGSNITPTWPYSSINENSNWLSANDPCRAILGQGWRIPTNTEWSNVKTAGNWTDYDGPWNSSLKIHAAGRIQSAFGDLMQRGQTIFEWSSVMSSNQQGFDLTFGNVGGYVNTEDKTTGMSVRCIY